MSSLEGRITAGPAVLADAQPAEEDPANTNDRITALGGTLRISSMPGAGTQVSGRIPVVGEDARRARDGMPRSVSRGRRA